MQGTPYEALVAYILSVDKSVLSYVLIIDALFSVAVVSLFSRNRRRAARQCDDRDARANDRDATKHA